MSSSESGDSSPTATPPPPPEELPDQPFKDHESFIEAGSALSSKTSIVVQTEAEIDALMSPTTPPSEEQFPRQSDKDHQDGTEETGLQFAGDAPTPDQAGISNHGHAGPLLTTVEVTADAEVKSRCQAEDDNRASSVPIVTPGEPDENPRILLDGPMPSVQEEEKAPSTGGGFEQPESPNLFPVTSSPVVPTSDEPSAPLSDLKTEQESPVVSAPDPFAASAEGSIDIEGRDEIAGGDGVNSDEEVNGGDEDDNAEDADDSESKHNPFDFKGAPVQATPNESPLDASSALQDLSANELWERMKSKGDRNNALDRLMALVGLENVKMQFLKIKATIDAARERKGWLRRQDLNMIILGNPGTGKTTVAEIYKDFLIESKVWTETWKEDVS
ncbi:uncharacterized protein B0H64DRAFT_85701 [Chaetomium fimeti]|uniref:ATPase AAA-type core domain-containing protein n=1 Tax=Chaetomium fimeti TaxID=1854472 RepID=A0AAE0LVD2_9PEZI|nr:hypothetical protein B0H64DRAFT_85701 [Chaetomium fimeti]